MKAEMSVLPSMVITDEILMRIPVESLMKFKAGCKEWNSRLSEPNFIFKHLDRSNKRFLGIDDKVRVINPMSGVVKSLLLPQTLQHGSMISSLVHCDGVFLCQHNSRHVMGLKLCLWNPFLNQLEWIRPRDFYGLTDCYGIGYHMRGQFKILRFVDFFQQISHEDEEKVIKKFYEQQIEIFETTSGAWKRIAATLDWCVLKSSQGVSLKGGMYWLAQSMREPKSVFIQSFDFSREAFIPICSLPIDLDYNVQHTNSLSVYRGDRLSLLHQGVDTRDIEVWLSTPLTDATVFWSQAFSVSTPDLPKVHAHSYFAQPAYFIDAKDVVVVLCREEDVTDEDSDVEQEPQIQIYQISNDGMHERVDMVQTAFYGHRVCGYVYMPSQVPVPNLGGH